VNQPSSAITNTELDPWWEMDLGEEKIIEYIDLWNTVALNGVNIEIPSSNFKDFYVLISDAPFGDVDLTTAQSLANYSYYNGNDTSRVFSLDTLNVKGRYIRVQANGMNRIGLAEVDVIGRAISTSADCNGDLGGSAYIDECGDCVKGNTVIEPCALNEEYIWEKAGAVLPVEMIQFDGELEKRQTRLYWSTALEENILGFDVEKSKRPGNWEKIDFVPANNKPSFYESWDPNPFVGNTYYRLKIHNLDGTYQYSNVVTIVQFKETDFLLYPNPTAGKINIVFEGVGQHSVDLKIVDVFGRTVYSEKISSDADMVHLINIDLSNAPAGNYFATINDGSRIETIPFLYVLE